MKATEVAEQLNVKVLAVWLMAKHGHLPSVNLPGSRSVRFRQSDVDAALKTRVAVPVKKKAAPRVPVAAE
jgi:excisionase family DNA binding protein